MGHEKANQLEDNEASQNTLAQERSLDTRITPPRGWVIYGLFSSTSSFGSAVSYTFGVMLPVIRQDFEITPAAAGFLAAMFNLFNALMAVPISNWFSRYNPIRLVAVAGFLSSLFLFLQATAWDFISLFGTRFLFVIAQSIKQPSRTLLIQQWIALRHVGLANGIGFAVQGLTQGSALAIAAVVIATLGGWRQTYLLMGAVIAVQTVIWMAVARQRRTASFEERFRSQEKTPLAALFKYRQFWIISVGLVGVCLPWTSFFAFLPTFLVEERGISLMVSGRIMALLFAGLTVGSLASGVLDRWVPKRRYLVAGGATILMVCPLIILNSSNVYFISVMGFMNGLGWGMWPVIQTLPYHLSGIKPREIAVLNGLLMCSVGLGFGLGALLAGILTQLTGSLFNSLLILACFPFLMILAAFFYPEKSPVERLAPPKVL